MQSIDPEWDIIRLLEEELDERQNVECFKYRLGCLKNSAETLQEMMQSENVDCESVRRVTNVLCKQLGLLWRDVYDIKN